MKLRNSGFSDIELMVTIGLPSLASFITRMRMDAEINDVLRGLNYARSEAAKQGLQVSVCPANGASCLAGTGVNWASGWAVMLTGAATNQILQINAPYTHGETLTSVASTLLPYPSNLPYPYFTGMGYTFFTGTLTLHDQNNTPSLYRCVVFGSGAWISQSGAACP